MITKKDVQVLKVMITQVVAEVLNEKLDVRFAKQEKHLMERFDAKWEAKFEDLKTEIRDETRSVLNGFEVRLNRKIDQAVEDLSETIREAIIPRLSDHEVRIKTLETGVKIRMMFNPI